MLIPPLTPRKWGSWGWNLDLLPLCAARLYSEKRNFLIPSSQQHMFTAQGGIQEQSEGTASPRAISMVLNHLYKVRKQHCSHQLRKSLGNTCRVVAGGIPEAEQEPVTYFTIQSRGHGASQVTQQ